MPKAMFVRILLAPLFLLLLAVFGCEAPSDAKFTTLGHPRPVDDPRVVSYATNLLQEGDVVSITFQNATNYNATQKITLDGQLNLEGVGLVKASGKTVEALQADLFRLYKPLVKEDVITVKLLASSASVYVSGAVVRPGKVAMERPLTALEAIMEAGGFDPYRAKISDVHVLRLEGGQQHTYRLNLKRALDGTEKKPFYLQPFDIVHVPTKTFNF
jgi:polysaccharide export outer membrane protein